MTCFDRSGSDQTCSLADPLTGADSDAVGAKISTCSQTAVAAHHGDEQRSSANSRRTR